MTLALLPAAAGGRPTLPAAVTAGRSVLKVGPINFKHAFRKYCGKEFYPHVVRSYYGTEKAKEFLKTYKTATKEEVQGLFLGIAEKLGHKKFVKKEHAWKDNYTVTIHHYIHPKILEKINGLVK